MPVARFQMPDGRVARFEVPEGTTPEQAQAMMEAHFAEQSAPAAPVKQPRGTVPTEQPRALPDISKLGMAATGTQTTPYGAEVLQGPVTLPGAIISGLGGGAQRGVAGIAELGARAVAAEGLQKGAKGAREAVPSQLAEYKEAYPYATGGAEFVGETIAPTAALTKAGQVLKAAGAAAPTLGRVLTPLGESIATGGFKTGLSPGVANRLLQVTGGATAGAGTAAMLQGDIGEGVVGGALIGGAVPIVLPALGRLGIQGLGKITDVATGKAPEVTAGRIAREAAGPELEAIQKALKIAPESETAGQAAAFVKQPTFQALQDLAERKGGQTGTLFKKLKAQEVSRKQQLAEISPILSEAEAARKETAGALYKQAFASDAQRMEDAARIAQQQAQRESAGLFPGGIKQPEPVPQIQAIKDNPIIKSAAKEAKILAESQGINIGNPMSSLQGLHYMKMAIDNQFANKTASTSLQKYNESALQATKQRLLNAIEGTETEIGLSPMYGIARQQYSELSKPVNQAMILDELQKILRSPGGVGEKESAFLNILGAGENALIKRAGGQPRFGGLREVLTPEQLAAFEDVAAQLQVNKLAAEQVAPGQEALAKIIKKETGGIRFPSLFGNRYTAAGNILLDELASKLDEKTMNALVRGMESGKTANELLNTFPSAERNKILLQLQKSAQKRPIKASVGAGQLQVERE